MSDIFVKLLGYSLIPFVTMVVAGAVATFRPPGDRLRSAILHAAAGIIFAAVGLELLPQIVHEHATIFTALGFAAGTAAMLTLRSLSRKLQPAEGGADSVSFAFLGAVAVDLLVDGAMIGVGFATGSKQGIFLTIALSLEAASLGLSVGSTLGGGSRSRAKSIGIIAGVASMFTVGALVCGLPLQGVSQHTLALVTSFGSAALLFLVVEELLTEAHELPESPWLTSAFFAGFLAYLLLELIGG